MADAAASGAVRRAPIALLDEATVAGIAAGEVVERPSSAVKELVENALDAGAASVRVDYDDRGATRIVVTDDGCGIAADEVALALTRHATSKIRGLADLSSVATFGFRGEALAAIASASDLELVTAVDADGGGIRVIVRSGRIVESAPAASRRGTRIDVQDLFAAVPARRKFLKSAAAEAGLVADVVRRFALARPDVHFVLTSSGRTALDVAPVADGPQRIRQVLGREVASALVEVDASLRGLRLRGFVSSPGASWGSSRRMALFCGGRWVRERLLFQAVLDGYRTHLLRGRFPAVVLFLDCEGGAVDFNVHPNKLEVRFADSDAVRGFVAEAVRDALRRSASPLGRWGLDAGEALRRRAVPGAAPTANATREAAFAAAGVTAPGGEGGVVPTEIAGMQQDAADLAARGGAVPPQGYALRESKGAEPRVADGAASAIPGYVPSAIGERPARPEEEQLAIDLGAGRARDALGRLEVVGQIYAGYLVCEGDGEVFLVDQHAGHERVLFEKLMQAFSTRAVARQALLVPARVDVGREGVEACAAAAAELEALGWEVEPFGEEEVVVRAVPAMAAGADPRALVEAVASDLVETGRARSAEKLAERVMATVACHSAVRVGKRLDEAGARALLREMAAVAYHSTCPHGRPVARRLARTQVERMFGR